MYELYSDDCYNRLRVTQQDLLGELSIHESSQGVVGLF